MMNFYICDSPYYLPINRLIKTKFYKILWIHTLLSFNPCITNVTNYELYFTNYQLNINVYNWYKV